MSCQSEKLDVKRDSLKKAALTGRTVEISSPPLEPETKGVGNISKLPWSVHESIVSDVIPADYAYAEDGKPGGRFDGKYISDENFLKFKVLGTTDTVTIKINNRPVLRDGDVYSVYVKRFVPSMFGSIDNMIGIWSNDSLVFEAAMTCGFKDVFMMNSESGVNVSRAIDKSGALGLNISVEGDTISIYQREIFTSRNYEIIMFHGEDFTDVDPGNCFDCNCFAESFSYRVTRLSNKGTVVKVK